MKRWQIVLVIVIVLGLIGGLELNIYLRHHPRTAKKISATPYSLKKSLRQATGKTKTAGVLALRSTKKQYGLVAQKTIRTVRTGALGKVAVGFGVLLGVVALIAIMVWLFRWVAKLGRAGKKMRVAQTADDTLPFAEDIPELPEHKDADVYADKVAEVLKVRRTVQAKREGKLSPLGDQQIRKYEVTNQVASLEGKVLRRIRSLVRIQNAEGAVVVERGEFGGYIEQEANLSHYRNSWVGDQAAVFGQAKVYGDAVVTGQAKVCDKARVYDLARVDGTAVIAGTAEVCGKVHISRGAYTEGKQS